MFSSRSDVSGPAGGHRVPGITSAHTVCSGSPRWVGYPAPCSARLPPGSRLAGRCTGRAGLGSGARQVDRAPLSSPTSPRDGQARAVSGFRIAREGRIFGTNVPFGKVGARSQPRWRSTSRLFHNSKLIWREVSRWPANSGILPKPPKNRVHGGARALLGTCSKARQENRTAWPPHKRCRWASNSSRLAAYRPASGRRPSRLPQRPTRVPCAPPTRPRRAPGLPRPARPGHRTPPVRARLRQPRP